MSELFSIQLQNRQQQGRDGVWLDLPTTTEQVQAALRQIGISSDNPQGLFVFAHDLGLVQCHETSPRTKRGLTGV